MWKATFIRAGDSYREPSRPLAVARVLVGSAALLQVPGLSPQLASLLTPGAFRAPYPISPPVSGASVRVVVGLMAILAVAAILGWQTRTALGGLTATIGFVLALDQQLYRSDLYLLFLECGLLSLAGSGAALSLDAARGGSKDFVEGWPVLLLKIQLSIIYASTALAKINPSFLRGEVLQASLRFAYIPEQLAILLSVVSILTECFLAVALWFRVTRRPAMLVGFLLHSAFVVLLAWGPQLVAFELEMLGLYVLFPRIVPGEYLVFYNCESSFIRTCIKWCRRADWLGACCLDQCSDPGAADSRGLEVVHGAKRFCEFEALREIACVLPLTWFLAPALSLPGLSRLGDWIYRSLIPPERSCSDGTARKRPDGNRRRRTPENRP